MFRKLVLGLLFVGLAAAPSLAGRTLKRGPGNLPPGGDAAMHEFCRDGGKGTGWNDDSSCYTATCLLYDWEPGQRQFTDCTAEATPDGACLENGERLMTRGALQNLTLAHQNTCPGGTIFASRFPGKDHGIYVYRGCQVSGSCPTTIGGEHYVRQPQVHTAVRLLGEGGKDLDGPEVNGRTGTWWIDDGGLKDGTSVDPDGSGAVIYGNRFHIGPTNGLRECDPDGAGGCDVTTTPPDNYWNEKVSQIARSSTLTDDMSHDDVLGATGHTELCVDNNLTNTGTCVDDGRVHCTVDGDCTDYGGTCIGFVEAVENKIDAGEEVWLFFDQGGYEWDKTAGPNGAWIGFARVRDADHTLAVGPAGACTGDGKNIYLGNPDALTHTWLWPFEYPKLDISEEPLRVWLLDFEKWNMGDGYNVESMNFMPQNWYGRDSSDPTEDCTVGNEAACDDAQMIRLGTGFNGGIYNSTFWYCSPSALFCIDNGGTIGTKFHNNLVANQKTGAGIDAGAWHLRDNVFMGHEDNTNAIINAFSQHFVSENDTFIGNFAGHAYMQTFVKGFRVTGTKFYGGNLFYNAAFVVRSGAYGSISDVFAQSVTGPMLMIDPYDGETVAHWSFKNWNVWGAPNTNWNPTSHSTMEGRGVISVTDEVAGGGDGGGAILDVRIEDFHAYTDREACLVWFDAGDDDVAGGAGANAGVEGYMAEFSITNSSIEGTNDKLACFGNDQSVAGNAHWATNAQNVIADYTGGPTSELPFLQNNMVNGVREPDFPYRVSAVAAAVAGDCDTLKHDTVVIINDDTAGQACTDAAPADGVLDGGGVANSVCICNRETTNWIPYF
jgi:hypothetical protein